MFYYALENQKPAGRELIEDDISGVEVSMLLFLKRMEQAQVKLNKRNST